MRRTFLQLVVAILLAGSAATPAFSREPIAPGPWRHVASKDFERETPGMGYSRRFDAPQGWADLYSYDLQKVWLDGNTDHEFDQLVAITTAEIVEAGRRGIYRDVKVSPAETLALADTPLAYVVFHYAGDQGPVESRLYLTCLNGRILKLRVSLREPLHRETPDRVGAFVDERIRAFRTERAVNTAQEPKAKKPERTFSIQANSEAFTGAPEHDGCALAFLLSRTRYFDERRFVFLRSGQPIAPGYRDELEAFSTTVQISREIQDAGKAIPSYWQRMQAVEAAGFLREYVVACRRHPAPSADAASLRLEEFSRWAAEHLAGLDHTEVDRYGSIALGE